MQYALLAEAMKPHVNSPLTFITRPNTIYQDLLVALWLKIFSNEA